MRYTMKFTTLTSIIIILLICLCKCLLADSGRWINSGLNFNACDIYEDSDQKDICSNFSIKSEYLQINSYHDVKCYEMLQRIFCSLRQINCGSRPKSLQMYDIPCQTSCISTIYHCGRGLGSLFEDYSVDKRLFDDDDTINTGQDDNYNYENQHYEQSEGDIKALDDWIWNADRYRRTTSFTSSAFGYPRRSFSRHEAPNGYHPQSRNYYSQFRSPLYPRNQLVRKNRKIPQDFFMNQNIGPPRGVKPVYTQDYTKYQSCLHLPTGICDDWTRQMMNHVDLDTGVHQEVQKKNLACPEDLEDDCLSMFPSRFNQTRWVHGNYSVVIQIKISQTIWWFGKEDKSYQPMFSFNVIHTFKSDIDRYDSKAIVTKKWPLKCGCMNEISPGSIYIMLAHSNLEKHKLEVSEKTVFLKKVPFYARRIQCWISGTNCIRRRYPRRMQRWPSVNRYN